MSACATADAVAGSLSSVTEKQSSRAQQAGWHGEQPSNAATAWSSVVWPCLLRAASSMAHANAAASDVSVCSVKEEMKREEVRWRLTSRPYRHVDVRSSKPP